MIESWLLGATIATISSIAAFGLVLTYFDPQTSGPLGLTLFLLTFGVSLLGILTILGYRLRQRMGIAPTDSIWASFRQSGLISGLVLATLILRWFHLYQGWMLLIGILLALGIEIYIRVGLKYKKPTPNYSETTGDDGI